MDVVMRRKWLEQLATWWPLILGLAVLYIPTFLDLVTGIWTSEAYAHGPIILTLSIWLIARQWKEMRSVINLQSHTAVGWFILSFGLFLYIVGRSQGILMFEVGSFVVSLAAVLLIMHGKKALAMQWFAFFFMLFIIPLPSTIVDTLTMPMKTMVSYATEHILFWAGFPIARTGVILQIGQYQLLVADACAGLQTLLTLEALGLFYLNVVVHKSPIRNGALAVFIVPISFTANVVRVIVLTLITYYFGDEAGQGFLHGFAGIVLFISALILIIIVDSVLQWAINMKKDGRALKS